MWFGSNIGGLLAPGRLRVDKRLKKCGAPITAEEIGIPQNKIIESILSAPNIRKRYTILREGISEMNALEAAKMTGVI